MTAHGEARRAFIAIHLSQEARRQLSETIASLGKGIPNSVRWVDPDGIHLTLKYLGDIDRAMIEDVLQAMEQLTNGSLPFQLHLEGLGVFPNQRRPRVLWAGVGGDLDALGALQEKVEVAMSGLNFPRERRAYNPHLTLGRVRDTISAVARQRIGDVISRGSLAGADSWPVNALHLMRSDLTPQGSVYSTLGSVSL
ncbi:MAG: 2'-5' RNA ligase [SAR202 cluster bacterium Io17-Chloro-G9]|nr:MAG: 2'-5' RNA ligase [SAR202 cluster bacterium Io17-Chloro-G9]